MLKKLKDKKGSSDDVIAAIFIVIVLIFLFVITVSYNIRQSQKIYVENLLRNAVTQSCKNGCVTAEINNNLKDSLNKMFAQDDYIITYKYRRFGENTDNDLLIDNKLYVGDTIYIQFNLNIPETGATEEQLKKQPLFNRVVNAFTGSTKIDRLLCTKQGVVEANAK